MSDNKTWESTIKQRSDGELYFEIPEDCLNRLGWNEGDDLDFKDNEDGTFTLTREKRVLEQLEFSEEELFKYMKLAHEEDITLNQWIERVLKLVIKHNDQLNDD